MKPFLTLLLLVSTLLASGREFTVAGGQKIEGEIVYSSESCFIIREEATAANPNPLFWVVAEITNIFLPDVANFVCLQIVGKENQSICDLIYNSVDFLTSLSGTYKKTVTLLGEIVEHVVERNTKYSSLYFTMQSLDLAYNVANTLEAYDKLDIVNWDKVENNYGELKKQYEGNITIANVTNKPVNFYVSSDGIKWENVILEKGQYKKIDFYQSSISQPYGFCKGDNMCNMQVYTNKSYKIRIDKTTRQHYLSET